MSKISIEIDTSQKTVVAKVDGSNIEDLRDLYVYTDKSGMGFAVELTSMTEGDNLKKVIRLMADKNGDLVEFGDVSKDIMEYFKS